MWTSNRRNVVSLKGLHDKYGFSTVGSLEGMSNPLWEKGWWCKINGSDQPVMPFNELCYITLHYCFVACSQLTFVDCVLCCYDGTFMGPAGLLLHPLQLQWHANLRLLWGSVDSNMKLGKVLKGLVSLRLKVKWGKTLNWGTLNGGSTVNTITFKLKSVCQHCSVGRFKSPIPGG
jgi:hypothetical protein